MRRHSDLHVSCLGIVLDTEENIKRTETRLTALITGLRCSAENVLIKNILN